MVTYVGIDVSKAKLDVALLTAANKVRSKVFVNDLKGHVALREWMDAHVEGGRTAAHVCMESTGQYHEAVAVFLCDEGVSVSIINPMLVKRFAESESLRVKTDKIDAKTLAQFAREKRPPLWEAPSPALRKLQAWVGRLDALAEMRQMEQSRLEISHQVLEKSHRETIDGLTLQVEAVKSLIRQTIDDDPDLNRRAALLDTIPGLGDRTIPQLLAYIGRPERFKSAKALAAYAGLVPWLQQSGTSLNKRRGTHPMGHTQLRKSLYFPAMVAGRYNPAIARFWQRLKAENKPGKVIVVACMHKLLGIVYAVLTTGKPFNADHGATMA